MKTNLYVCAALIAAGMVAHFIKKLYDLEQAGTILSPREYARSHPYGVALAVIGGYLFASLLYFAGQLNESVSILTGVMCSEAFDSLRARAAGKLRDDGVQSGV